VKPLQLADSVVGPQIDKLHTLKYLKIYPNRRTAAVRPTSDLRRSRSKLIYLRAGNSPQKPTFPKSDKEKKKIKRRVCKLGQNLTFSPAPNGD